MEFSQEDIIRLYGKRFFLLPDEVTSSSDSEPEADAEGVAATQPSTAPPAESASPSAPPAAQQEVESYASTFQQGAPVEWKMKPHAQLALLLQASEFSDRALTTALKGYIVKAGISTEVVGFGIIPDDCPAFDMQQMPVKVGVVFKLFEKKMPIPVQVDDKQLFVAADLGLIHIKEAFQKRLTEILVLAHAATQDAPS